MDNKYLRKVHDFMNVSSSNNREEQQPNKAQDVIEGKNGNKRKIWY